MSSAFVLVTTAIVVLVTLLAWPFRALWRALTGPAAPTAAISRLIVVGSRRPGPEAHRPSSWREGILPNFSALAATGSYRRLTTTFPSVSPVAWSSFSTGTHPARHNIFDFLDRDRRTYLPVLSSTRIGKVDRFLKIGRYRIPLRKPELRLLRRSKPFWTILGEHRIWSTILRVPITFPPDQFYGAELSAMCVPDLLGTQGTFLLYTTRAAGAGFKEGGDAPPGVVRRRPDGQHAARSGQHVPRRRAALDAAPAGAPRPRPAASGRGDRRQPRPALRRHPERLGAAGLFGRARA